MPQKGKLNIQTFVGHLSQATCQPWESAQETTETGAPGRRDDSISALSWGEITDGAYPGWEGEVAKTAMSISWCRPKERAGRKYFAGRFHGRARTRVSVVGASLVGAS